MTNEYPMTNDQCRRAGSRVIYRWRLVIGHWTFFGHWSLVIGHWSLSKNDPPELAFSLCSVLAFQSFGRPEDYRGHNGRAKRMRVSDHGQGLRDCHRSHRSEEHTS